MVTADLVREKTRYFASNLVTYDGLYPLVTLRFIPLVDVKRFFELLELQSL